MEKRIKWFESQPVIILLTIILTLPALLLLSIGHIILIFYIPFEKMKYKSTPFYKMYYNSYHVLVIFSNDFKIRNELAKLNVRVESSNTDNKYKLIDNNKIIAFDKVNDIVKIENNYFVKLDRKGDLIPLDDYYSKVKYDYLNSDSDKEFILLLSNSMQNTNYLNEHYNNVYFIDNSNKFEVIKNIVGTYKDNYIISHNGIFLSHEEHQFSECLAVEFAYCKHRKDQSIKKIVNNVKYNSIESIFLPLDKYDDFNKKFGDIFNNGTYNNLEKGPLDINGINYFDNAKIISILAKLEKYNDSDSVMLKKWLLNKKEYNGIYVLGV